MAGTRFTLSTLIASTEKRRADGRKPYADAVDALDAPSFAAKVDAWRKAEERRVLELARRIRSQTETVTDAELSRFAVNDVPTMPGSYAERNARGNLKNYDEATELIVSFVRSLAADEHGIVELSAADLRRLGFPS